MADDSFEARNDYAGDDRFGQLPSEIDVHAPINSDISFVQLSDPVDNILRASNHRVAVLVLHFFV